MKPTIGRIVHYYNSLNQKDNANSEILPAIIVKVHNETCVNLQVFLNNNISGIHFKSSVIQGTQIGHWDWPKIEEVKRESSGLNYQSGFR